MKENKDKSILIPGIAAAAPSSGVSTTKKAVKALAKKLPVKKLPVKKAKSKVKAVVVEELKIEAKAVETIDATVDSQIMPVVSQIFKSAWETIAKKKIVKSKSKTKAKQNLYR